MNKYLKRLILMISFGLVMPQMLSAKPNTNTEQNQNQKGKKGKGKKGKGKKGKGKKGKGKKGKAQQQNKRAKRYPMKVNARPLVLPTGMNEISSVLSLTSNQDINTSALGLSFKRGIVSGLEVGASTGMSLHPEVDWGSQFILRGGYKIGGGQKGLALAAQVDIPLGFGEHQDVLSAINAGVAARYRINRQLALHSGEGLISLNFSDKLTTSINIPIGVAFQVNKQLNLRADTKLLGFGNGGDLVSLFDTLPLTLRGLYTINRMMDAGAIIQTDVIANTGWSLMGVFNYRL